MGPGICLLLRTRLGTLIRFEGLAWSADLILDELLGLSGPDYSFVEWLKNPSFSVFV